MCLGSQDVGAYTQTRFSDSNRRNICGNRLNPDLSPEMREIIDNCLRPYIAHDNYFDWIIRDNGGRGYVDTSMLMIQVGADARYDRWNFGLSVLFLQSFLSSEADRVDALYKAAYPNDTSPFEEADFEGLPLPTAYVFYDVDAEKQHSIGLAGGFLGIFLGGSIFYVGQFFDQHFTWTVAVDYSTSLANQLIADSNQNAQGRGDTSQLEDFSLSFRAGATLEF